MEVRPDQRTEVIAERFTDAKHGLHLLEPRYALAGVVVQEPRVQVAANRCKLVHRRPERRELPVRERRHLPEMRPDQNGDIGRRRHRARRGSHTQQRLVIGNEPDRDARIARGDGCCHDTAQCTGWVQPLAAL